MHINFVTHKQFKLDIGTLKERIKGFRLNNFSMIIIAGSAIFLMIFIGVVQKLRVDHLGSKKIKTDISINKLRSELSEKGVAEAQLVGKAALLKNYERRRDWSSILKKVTGKITSGVWVQSIKGGGEKESGDTIVVSGVAPTQNAVAVLMESLGTIPGLGDVRLVSSTTPDKEKSGKISFSIQLRIK